VDQASTLHERFRDTAARYPDRPAVTAGPATMTYYQLARLADEVADRLAGVLRPEDRLVGLRVTRQVSAPAALIGVLAAGRGYVPIDPEYPAARQEYLLGDCGLAMVVTDGELRADEVAVATAGPFTVARRTAPGAAAVVPDDTAYVIYTSGSTGAPKGCIVGHCHVLALFDGTDGLFDFTEHDVWTGFHSFSFDFSVWELWGPLLTGGRVVIVPAHTAADPEAFKTLLAEQRVSVLSQVPSSFGSLTRELALSPVPLPHLRHVVFGGEAIVPADLERWERLGLAPNAVLTNMYGITETTVHVTFCRLTPKDLAAATPGTTPIGVALPHLEVRIMDDAGRPVPALEPGEMWVGGTAVTYGYLNRPEQTAHRFVTIDEGGSPQRFYRSGDHAVRHLDGSLYYVGRMDHQVQLRGYRIELAEVEAAIRALPGVASAACGVEELRTGHQVLVAYIVPAPGTDVSDKQLQEALAESLPQHMRPQRFRRLAALPITGNGKLDRGALATTPTKTTTPTKMATPTTAATAPSAGSR
jgi:nonribosomal peptide synthetase DhbF